MISNISKQTVLLGPITASVSKKISRLCLCPYYNHPRGCPNFNHRKDCPPRAGFFLDQFQPQVFLAIVIFNFDTYLKLKKIEHPTWSERALGNSRHWQGHLRAVLKNFVKEKIPPGYSALFNAEAMGVNLTETCRRAGLRLEWPPRKKVCVIAVLAKTL